MQALYLYIRAKKMQTLDTFPSKLYLFRLQFETKSTNQPAVVLAKQTAPAPPNLSCSIIAVYYYYQCLITPKAVAHKYRDLQG